MSFFKIPPDQLETFTLVTSPSHTFVTSSAGSIGAAYVYPRRSPFERETYKPGTDSVVFEDSSITSLINDIKMASTSSTNIFRAVKSYVDAVHALPTSHKYTAQVPITRFSPGNTFSENVLRKSVVQKHLMSQYRSEMPTAHWAYTNYHAINFVQGIGLPTGSVLLYPNVPVSNSTFASGSYVMTGAMTFEFYVNPRFVTNAQAGFRASTLLHLSSCYAISVISGSSRDHNNNITAYRVMLQLSHSADISPSLAYNSSYPRDLVFTSDDNSLPANEWSHVVIRWGTNEINHGTGTIAINGQTKCTFVVPSSSLAPSPTSGKGSPDVLCIGNYYAGTNIGTSQQAYFFAQNTALRDGLIALTSDTSRDEPATYSFSHPFNAEFHDLAIIDGYVTDDIVVTGSWHGRTNMESVRFFLPPFFTSESPWRRSVGGFGGVMQTPVSENDGTTDDPFNVALAFGVGGHSINIENFVRDFATGRYPRVHQMSASAVTTTFNATSANAFLYDSDFVKRRNTLILPCDDGRFVPNFDLLITASLTSSFYDDIGSRDYSWISLRDMIPSGNFAGFMVHDSGSYFEQLAGASPETPGVAQGSVLTIFQRTRDNTSNAVTFFNVSNLYYGNRILPGSFSVTDYSLSGTAGALGMTLRDDGNGNLFRADCSGTQATWNSVGNIFYSEGIAVVKSPHLNFFGADGYKMSFSGENTVHTMKINVLVGANTLNSSSNTTFGSVSASFDANEVDGRFVYISDLYLMDDNMNVVMKTALAQPILKRYGEKYLFRVQYDF